MFTVSYHLKISLLVGLQGRSDRESVLCFSLTSQLYVFSHLIVILQLRTGLFCKFHKYSSFPCNYQWQIGLSFEIINTCNSEYVSHSYKYY